MPALTRAAALALLLLGPLALTGCPRNGAPTGGPSGPALRPGHGLAGPEAALIEASADTDPGVRGLALATLIRVDAAPGGGAYGPRAAYDPSPYVQRLAVEALGDRRAEPEAQALLLQIASRPGLGRYVACAAALRAPSSDALIDVIDANLNDAPTWAQPPCALAAMHHGRPGAEARAAAALAKGELPLELGFLRDLAEQDARALQPALEAALAEVEPELAAPLAALLLGWGSAPAEAALRAMLDDADRMTRIGAIDELGQCAAPAATALLRRAAEGPEPERSYARLHLAARGEGGVAELLEAAADASDRERRARAISALGGALSTPEPDRRLQRAASELFRLALADEDNRVQLAALRALRRAPQVGQRAETTALMVEAESLGRVRAEAALTSLVLEAAARKGGPG